MSKPSDAELRSAYEACGGNHRKVHALISKKHAPFSYDTMRGRLYRMGLQGKGIGGTRSVRPSDEDLLALHEKHSGHFTNMARELGVSQGSVTSWMGKLGIQGSGREKFTPIYPMQLPISVRDGHVVIYSDAHFWPAARSRAYEALLIALRKLKPKVVIGNGDLLDGARISRHDPIGWDDLPTLEDELHEGKIRQTEIAKAAPQADKIGVIGNHDARFEKYVIKYARELEGIPGMRLADHFPDWRICWSVKINHDVVVKHRMRGGVHATYNNTLHAGLTIVTGHLHSQNVRPKTDYRGTRWGVDAGCLADPGGPQFLYLEANPVDWRSGFCVLTFEKGRLLPPQLATVLDDGTVYMQRNERVL